MGPGSYKERKLTHGETHKHSQGCMKTQEKTAVCKPGGEASGETEPAHLILDFQPSELWEISFAEAPRSGAFC